MFDFLSKKLSTVRAQITGNNKLTQKNINDTLLAVRQALIEADVPFAVVEAFLNTIQEEVVGKNILASLKPAEQFIAVVQERLATFLGGKSDDWLIQVPAVIMMCGLQGAGKTTTIGKLATYLLQQKSLNKPKILVASVDFYRPAALDQLAIVAKKAGADFYKAKAHETSQATAEIMAYVKQQHYDVVLLDTAGRMHLDKAMMEEIQVVARVARPQQILLVLDGMTGQESVDVAKTFDAAIGITGAIITKMDSGARGGAAFAFRYMVKKPIFFMGNGEKQEDLEPFRPERIAGALLGEGDLQTLLEKAEAKIQVDEQERLQKALLSGSFTLQDFADQLGMMQRLGSLSSLMSYMPGMSAMKMTPQMVQQGELELKRFRAILQSMTPKERLKPVILNNSRKQRIARGAGVRIQEVNNLLSRFEQTQQFVKIFKGMGSSGRFFT